MKICPVGAKLFHVDGRMNGRTDRNCEANSRFLQFCGNAYRVRIYRNYTNPFIIYISDATRHEVRINFITKVSHKKNMHVYTYTQERFSLSVLYIMKYSHRQKSPS